MALLFIIGGIAVRGVVGAFTAHAAGKKER